MTAERRSGDGPSGNISRNRQRRQTADSEARRRRCHPCHPADRGEASRRLGFRDLRLSASLVTRHRLSGSGSAEQTSLLCPPRLQESESVKPRWPIRECYRPLDWNGTAVLLVLPHQTPQPVERSGFPLLTSSANLLIVLPFVGIAPPLDRPHPRQPVLHAPRPESVAQAQHAGPVRTGL